MVEKEVELVERNFFPTGIWGIDQAVWIDWNDHEVFLNVVFILIHYFDYDCYHYFIKKSIMWSKNIFPWELNFQGNLKIWINTSYNISWTRWTRDHLTLKPRFEGSGYGEWWGSER